MNSLSGIAGTGFLPDRIRGVARWAPFIIIALVGAIGAVATHRIVADSDDARVQGTLDLRADWRAGDLHRKLENHGDAVGAAAVLLASQATLDPVEFQRFAVLSHAPDALQRLAWAPQVLHHEAGAGAGSGPPPGSGSARQSGAAPSFPVAIGHRFTDAPPLAGRDLAAEPTRRAIIEQARDDGRPLGTPVLPLLNSATIGYVLFWPIYQTGVVPRTVEERRQQFRGILEGTFGLEAALTDAIAGTPRIVEAIYFFVGQQPGSSAPDATYLPARGTVTLGGEMPAAPPAGGRRITRTFDVFGQQWRLVLDFPAAVVTPLRSSAVWALPGAFLLLTALLLGYLVREQERKREMERQIGVRTFDLRAANDALAAEIEARQKTHQQLMQAQKMEAVGNLTGGMAHDFNNLLAIVIGNLDLLRDRQTADPEVDDLTGSALDAALRGADLTRRLLAFARRQPLQPALTGVNGLVAEIVKLLQRTLGEQIQIALDLNPDTWPVLVDPAQLESALTNLATNARDAMPRGGKLIFATGNRSLDADYAAQHAEVQPGDYALIEVSDTGTGMPAEVVDHIFEPFYTTKEQGRGTGLGLSMVYGFIKQSGGHINVYSEIGIGTIFRLYLQRAGAATERGRAIAPAAVVRGSGETVLAVEDNAGLRRVVVRQLTELGYRVREAQDAQTALRVLESEPVDLLLTDIVMPGGASGYEIADAVASRWPKTKIVLTSGFPENRTNGDARPPNLRLLSKPYRRDDLGRLIRDVLDA